MMKKTCLFLMVSLLAVVGLWAQEEQQPVNLVLPGNGNVDVEKLNGGIDLNMDVSRLNLYEIRVLKAALGARQGELIMTSELRRLFDATSWYTEVAEKRLLVRDGDGEAAEAERLGAGDGVGHVFGGEGDEDGVESVAVVEGAVDLGAGGDGEGPAGDAAERGLVRDRAETVDVVETLRVEMADAGGVGQKLLRRDVGQKGAGAAGEDTRDGSERSHGAEDAVARREGADCPEEVRDVREGAGAVGDFGNLVGGAALGVGLGGQGAGDGGEDMAAADDADTGRACGASGGGRIEVALEIDVGEGCDGGEERFAHGLFARKGAAVGLAADGQERRHWNACRKVADGRNLGSVKTVGP